MADFIPTAQEQRKWYYQNPEQNCDAFHQSYTTELAQQHAAVQALPELAK